tara:strand:- start:6328 stop:7662 length:1335 start_codon:yes stop_codon:yes gene_type:complete
MATPQTVAFHTLGCKLNFSESSTIRRKFEEKGFSTLSFEEAADVYVINTCSVTDFADRKCRSTVRKALRLSPEAKVIVIGCYAQLKPNEIADIPGVDLVLGAGEKFNVVNYVDNISKSPHKGMVRAGEIKEVNSFEEAFSFGDRTRTFLKVQDGCNYKCTFCTIPLARGASRSDTAENVVENAQKIAEKGCKEIVLTGVNIGDFGNGTEVIEGVRPKKEALFVDLIKALEKEVNGIERFRISSIEPNLCSDEVIEFVAKSERFVPHFHMPLQSGSDTLLAMMKRRYKRQLYQERVTLIKKLMPHACIGVDVIVGFPGETDEYFKETFDFISDLDVSYLHVFTYSERPNTPAVELEDIVPMQIRRQRNEALRRLSEKKKLQFYRQHLGEERTVLFEESKSTNMMTGFTDNYIKVEIPRISTFINTIRKVRLNSLSDNGLIKSEIA